MNQWRKVTYRSILEVDVVILSSTFYLRTFEASSLEYYEIPFTIENVETLNSCKLKLCGLHEDDHCPRPSHFGWHRIIHDEAHESLNQFWKDSYVSSYCWYVTGTPFDVNDNKSNAALNRKSCLAQIANFLQVSLLFYLFTYLLSSSISLSLLLLS